MPDDEARIEGNNGGSGEGRGGGGGDGGGGDGRGGGGEDGGCGGDGGNDGRDGGNGGWDGQGAEGGDMGGDDGGRDGGGMIGRGPQSVQSCPYAHDSYSEPGPPSLHALFDATLLPEEAEMQSSTQIVVCAEAAPSSEAGSIK